MARLSQTTTLLTAIAGLLLLGGTSCPSDPGGGILPPGAQPFDPSQGITLIVMNDAGVPLEAELKYYLTGIEVRRTILDLASTGQQQSADALPTRADRVTIVGSADAAETLSGKSSAAREIIDEVELLLDRDYVFGDTLTIRLTFPPPPHANAGLDRLAVSGQPVNLDGNGSQSSAGGALSFSWQQISGIPVTLNNGSTATPDFVAPVVDVQSTLEFRLTVTEGRFAASDDVQVIVRPDCNLNATADGDDIASGQSHDCNHDGIPDECHLSENDCNSNGVPDECDTDCDHNGIPDVCDHEAPDCDENGVPDSCDPEAADVEGFVAALLGPYGDGKSYYPCHFDANQDGYLDGLDVQPFVLRLIQQAGG